MPEPHRRPQEGGDLRWMVKEFLVYTVLRLGLLATLAIIVGIWTVRPADGRVADLAGVVLAFAVSGIGVVLPAQRVPRAVRPRGPSPVPSGRPAVEAAGSKEDVDTSALDEPRGAAPVEPTTPRTDLRRTRSSSPHFSLGIDCPRACSTAIGGERTAPGPCVFRSDGTSTSRTSHPPSGSLKHRLARSLFLYGLCNGWIGPGDHHHRGVQRLDRVSEAYFAQMLGLRFIAVMPRSTSPEKIAAIEFYGGESHFVDSAAEMYAESARLAASLGGHYMDQFTYAERATDWRGNNNIAESIFSQMARERTPCRRGSSWGWNRRHVRDARALHPLPPVRHPLCVADPENSPFLRGWLDQPTGRHLGLGFRIEGIGRPRVEPPSCPARSTG